MQLELTIEEVNTILLGLGTQPYIKVRGLIEKIHREANKQLQNNDTTTSTEGVAAKKAEVELTK